ncbi:hypothetical protein DA2_1921 [Desulfovibrio sp. A2]|nr:hypothetical protein DA2_1921 [Desulfovibrio sp. A2]
MLWSRTEEYAPVAKRFIFLAGERKTQRQSTVAYVLPLPPTPQGLSFWSVGMGAGE